MSYDASYKGEVFISWYKIFCFRSGFRKIRFFTVDSFGAPQNAWTARCLTVDYSISILKQLHSTIYKIMSDFDRSLYNMIFWFEIFLMKSLEQLVRSLTTLIKFSISFYSWQLSILVIRHFIIDKIVSICNLSKKLRNLKIKLLQ